MLLSINNTKENIPVDDSGFIDLFDFAYIIDKYLGSEVCSEYSKAMSALVEDMESLEDYIRELEEKIQEYENQVDEK